MTIAEQNLTDPGLTHLDGTPYDGVLAWLERALRGNEALPVVVPGEPPEDTILRHEQKLDIMTRKDLREACRHLVRRFMRNPSDDDSFVAALFRLAKGFPLPEVASDIYILASEKERFMSLPTAQQKTLLSTLLDLNADLPTAFWHQLAAHDPGRFGVVAFSSILRKNPMGALQLLPSLPDDERVADAIYVVLEQRAPSLNPAECDEFVIAARTEADRSTPVIQSAINEWANAQPPVQRRDAPPMARPTLARALENRAIKRQETYSPVPRSARLLAAPI